VQGEGLKRQGGLALAAVGGAVAILLAAAQPVSGTSPAGSDTLYSNLESRLDELEPDDRTSVIVQLDAPASDESIAKLERAVGPLAIGRRFSIVNGFSASASRSQIEALARAPGVRQVESNPVVVGANDKAQAAFGVSKARLDLPSLDGAGISVAVLDSGIDATHPDLDEGKVRQFKDFVHGQTTPYDDNGHGTHVSAIVAGDGDGSGGLYRGVAPAADIVAVKVLNSTLKGGGTAVISGIDWVVVNKNALGIKVIVLSLQTHDTVCEDGTDALSTAVNGATAQGLLVVVAAGNEGPGLCTIGSPGVATEALTVGAMADTGEGGFQLAPFSSRGPTGDGRVKPDVVGPGVGITSARSGGGYEPRSGTSMAAPFVAGVAALMLDANQSLTPHQLKDTITGTAVDWGRGGDNTVPGATGRDIDYGAGRLDAYAAIRAAGAALGAPPPVPAHEVYQGSVSDTGTYVDHEISVDDTAFPMAATLIIPGASPPNFDLALFNPSGTEVAASRGVVRQEQLSIQPATAGAYTLRVSSSSGAGSYFIDISGATSSQPSNAGLPTITGTAREGELLRAQAGAWSGGLPLSFVFQWLRCDGNGTLCGPVPGAAGQEYQPGGADIDGTIRVMVTATNRAGSSSATSAGTGTVVALPPRIVDPPSIVGTARDGSTLHVERGSWQSSRPFAVTHQWLRCSGGGAGCTELPGATAPTYLLGPVDIGTTVTVTVTAANGGGQESVTATPVAVGARRPEVTTQPVVSGRARTGAVLRADEGRWLGTLPLEYNLRWQRCAYNGRGCETIRGVVGPRYVVRPSDAGTRLRIRVRADNSTLPGGGATLAYSEVTRIVQPAASWYEAGAGRVVVLTGTNRRDVIMGTPGTDIIRGLGGDDRIVGRGGNDVILGGEGRDRLIGGKGRDLLRGQAGPDTLVGGPGMDELLGGAGADVFSARDGRADTIVGGSGRDSARFDRRRDHLTGIERLR
jgi:serine protease AprX